MDNEYSYSCTLTNSSNTTGRLAVSTLERENVRSSYSKGGDRNYHWVIPGRTERYRNATAVSKFRMVAPTTFMLVRRVADSCLRLTRDQAENVGGLYLIIIFRTSGRRKLKNRGLVETIVKGDLSYVDTASAAITSTSEKKKEKLI
jgi:hypothetical protein